MQTKENIQTAKSEKQSNVYLEPKWLRYLTLSTGRTRPCFPFRQAGRQSISGLVVENIVANDVTLVRFRLMHFLRGNLRVHCYNEKFVHGMHRNIEPSEPVACTNAGEEE